MKSKGAKNSQMKEKQRYNAPCIVFVCERIEIFTSAEPEAALYGDGEEYSWDIFY